MRFCGSVNPKLRLKPNLTGWIQCNTVESTLPQISHPPPICFGLPEWKLKSLFFYLSAASWIHLIQLLRSSLELVWTSYISGPAEEALIRNIPLSSLATSLTMSLWREITEGFWSWGKQSQHMQTVNYSLIKHRTYRSAWFLNNWTNSSPGIVRLWMFSSVLRGWKIWVCWHLLKIFLKIHRSIYEQVKNWVCAKSQSQRLNDTEAQYPYNVCIYIARELCPMTSVFTTTLAVKIILLLCFTEREDKIYFR